MKLKDVKSSATVIYALVLFTLLFLNVFLGIRPIADYINYLEQSKLFFLIPLSLLLPIGLFLFDKVRYKKLMHQKAELFHATVQNVQDNLKDSNNKMKLLISEMQEAAADNKLVNRAKEILEKSNSLLNSLYKLEKN